MCYEKEIIGFKKTDHCLLRQWERKISDRLLYLILKYARFDPEGKCIFIGTWPFLKKWLEKGDYIPMEMEGLNLIVVLDCKYVITCFFCKDPEYLNKRYPGIFQKTIK